jgi:integrase
MNSYLKEIGELVGIDEKTTRTFTKGGLKASQLYKKFELITTHTARRSFATNLYKAGFPSLSIMKITGHKTETSFMKYIKISHEENANKLLEFWQNNTTLRLAK